MPDRAGNGSGELIVLLSTITRPRRATGPAPMSSPPSTTSAGVRREVARVEWAHQGGSDEDVAPGQCSMACPQPDVRCR